MPSGRRQRARLAVLIFAAGALSLSLAAPSFGAIYAGRALVAQQVAQRPAQQQSAEAARTATRSALDFVWPADGTVSSPFGPRGSGFHPGIDIGMLRSLAVRAAGPGTVTGAGYLTGYEGYGLVVVVDIGSGYSVLYAHLSRAAVSAGQSVEQGDPIGTAGCTGSCTGTHPHFELRLNGKAIDPAPYLH